MHLIVVGLRLTDPFVYLDEVDVYINCICTHLIGKHGARVRRLTPTFWRGERGREEEREREEETE